MYWYGKHLTDEIKLKISQAKIGKPLSDEHKRKLSDSIGKIYTLISPDGNVITIKNLRKFCIENNMRNDSMGRVIHGTRNSYRGWTVEKKNK